MDLNKFETKLNTDKLTKDDIRNLLDYTFKLKEENEEMVELLINKGVIKVKS